MISQGEITVPRKFRAISMCLMVPSIYFNVLLHCNFPHQKRWHLFNFQEDELVFLHYKTKETTKKKKHFKSQVEYTGEKRPAWSVMAISQFIFCRARHAFKNNFFILPKLHPNVWWNVLMAVRSCICGLSLTAGEWSGVPAKSLGLRIWWIPPMKTRMKSPSSLLSAPSKWTLTKLLICFFFASSKWC